MKKLISLTIDPELHERIKKIAATKNRSLSNLIETLLTDYADNEENAAKVT